MSFGEYLRCFAVPLVLVAIGMAVAVAPLPAPPERIAAAQCAALSSTDSAGSILAEAMPGGASLAAYCRVTGMLRPVPGSSIGFQLWLPVPERWSGRLQMLGNGGYSSALPLPAMAEALQRGSAVIATDTGHQGDDPDFAAGRPEAIVDWGSRAVHLSLVQGEKLVARFYGRPATRRYFNGCSTGGHQALMEAQRFPADFDGIVAGAPGSDRVRLNAAFLWQYRANHRPGDNASPILSRPDLDLLARGSFAACHGANGVSAGGLASDPWLNDPTQCRFDPGVLACKPGQSAQCLSSEKVEAARKMYRGAPDPRTGEPVTTPWLPGSETGWGAYWADPRHPGQPARLNFWRIWAFGDPGWDWWRFDYGRQFSGVQARLSPVIDATDPDLRRFRARGGKLLQYHGLSDPVVSPLDSIRYYERATRVSGRAGAWYRLFLVPGMGHCGGGPGFSRFDAQAAIERWVESGAAPDRIIAGQATAPIPKHESAATRPLCPYPQKAVFAPGARDAASGFACARR